MQENRYHRARLNKKTMNLAGIFATLIVWRRINAHISQHHYKHHSYEFWHNKCATETKTKTTAKKSEF